MVSLAGVAMQPGNATQETLRIEAEKKLRRQEKLAFSIVVISPILGGYLLLMSRNYLSQFDKYFSQLNITIFILAAGIKPITFLAGLLKKRALMLQEEIHYPVGEIEGLRRRVGLLENELNQLRKAYATKLEVGQIRDRVEPTLLQISTVLQRYDRREQKIRARCEEKLSRLERKLNEFEFDDISNQIVNPVQRPPPTLLGILSTTNVVQQ
ncbi:hypothetical protein K493DRAFT_409246 [Basidiobolus meristosporus CBS 931.73]|uniref:Uncharacterized protein n=1 Tax=Basidiobolus meristosporus CBS 931.73 TaxID=1314790 RepID=A0A1Y1Y0U6_9FUNG|nr:hypothetical protein K493DRAFT_409246 [Basidiobolus meristosporus CBS 931.73]|eukprot:ORX91620.1 hypothetical protein K493DRAFT_409246 [Basidiobolus meristosporus CBS 931.73]